jgi:hypothetical protein
MLTDQQKAYIIFYGIGEIIVASVMLYSYYANSYVGVCEHILESKIRANNNPSFELEPKILNMWQTTNRAGRGAPNTFEQTGAARSQIGLPHPPEVTAMLAISMICFGHHDGFPRKIVCRQIRGQFDCLVSELPICFPLQGSS